MALVSRPDELNIPVLNVKVPNANVPLVNVVVPVAAKENVVPRVVVPEVLAIVNNASVVLVLLVIVPVPTMVAVKLVNVPPLLNVNPFKFNDVAAIVNTVLPKLNVLNQLPVVNVNTDVPLPVNDRFGALVIEPPVVPNVNVLVLVEGLVNPPVVAVTVNPVTIAIFNTVVAAVVH